MRLTKRDALEHEVVGDIRREEKWVARRFCRFGFVDLHFGNHLAKTAKTSFTVSIESKSGSLSSWRSRDCRSSAGPFRVVSNET